jgi:hypothetical protein
MARAAPVTSAMSGPFICIAVSSAESTTSLTTSPFITSQNVEFEYSFLSSVLRIDRIIAKRKRKPIVKVDVKRFDDFFPYSDSEMDKRKFNKIYHAAHQEFSEENYVASFRDEGKGKCAIIFTPNEDLLNEMKLYFGNELRKNLFKNKQL